MKVTLNEVTDRLELNAETSEDLEELTKVRDLLLEETNHLLIAYGNDDRGLTCWLWIRLRKQ